MKKIKSVLLVICIIAASVQAQQIKSLDEIDAASFLAGPAPFDKKSLTVNLSDGSIKHANAPIDISLNGEWQLVEGGADNERLNDRWTNSIKAIVPGSVHSALWKAGIIPDPYFGRNDSFAEKFCYKTWYYKKEFTLNNILNAPRLIFDGVANKCSVWLNGLD